MVIAITAGCAHQPRCTISGDSPFVLSFPPFRLVYPVFPLAPMVSKLAKSGLRLRTEVFLGLGSVLLCVELLPARGLSASLLVHVAAVEPCIQDSSNYNPYYY
ncbi:hypothetical protein THAOC_04315 [Thalassiosira oceanica]|uniref:Uncharacterized protein n=1 Tax=Thalassiosira oceanica TaxID=159749 RepID=K0TA96_THAOC|nr:hypothetical protein THAOC_04315 [Thalassiosira oceanica]|eukprot:EJK74029.1 hypothetical protein THAOC_04315 [Thalassiosira oceanica]